MITRESLERWANLGSDSHSECGGKLHMLDLLWPVVEASSEAVNAQMRTFGALSGNHASAYAAQAIHKALTELEERLK